MDKIAFARLVMTLTQWGMRYLEQHELIELEQMVKPPVEPQKQYASVETVNDFMNALRRAQFIEAIKAHRALTGLGLKESKDQVEAWRAWFPVKQD